MINKPLSILSQLFLALLSALLLWLSWYPYGFSLLSFLALVPLFIVSENITQYAPKRHFLKGLGYSYITFCIWNVLTTWWIWNSTPVGAILAMFLNAFFMSLVFGIWQWSKRFVKKVWLIPLFFISFWCSWEYLHLNWDISWPWLNLGNLFAPNSEWVQWYEFTGIFGGTIWILTANFLCLYFIKYLNVSKKKAITFSASLLAIIIIPIALSLLIYTNYHINTQNNDPINTVIIQQNTDPWEEEYSMSNTEQIARILQIASPNIDNNTNLLVCPESAIPHNVAEIALLEHSYDAIMPSYFGFDILDSFLVIYPKLNIITGLSTFNIYNSKVRPTARATGQPDRFVELYNTAACIQPNFQYQFYHKSKLVPGVEIMPYPKIFGFLEDLAIDLGGTSGSLGIDSVQRPFSTMINQKLIKIAAPVCYESIYGKLCGNFVKAGAQVICVITNDAWWGDTPGYQQHFICSKLRAIECRRTVLRAANTGISAVINEKGDVIAKTNYNERTSLKATVYPNDKLTFYVKYGDYLAKIAILMMIACFIYLFEEIWSKFVIKKTNPIIKI
ncbi:MAG: apolipoprotein N-acyltransferase [Bacteroidales bacterium]|jgi:apolipoprotein N-acyltransferase|nr:apolipoprotein N-acyltransferase [Bacteroidales bacterium]